MEVAVVETPADRPITSAGKTPTYDFSILRQIAPLQSGDRQHPTGGRSPARRGHLCAAGTLGVLGSTFIDWDALAVKTSPAGQQRAVFDNPTPTLEKFEVHVTTLNPGMSSHPPHHHPWEEMLLIKEGSVEVSINGQKHRAGPGYLIFFASNDPHNLTNIGDKPATYYVINFYTDLVHTVADKPAVEQAVPGKLASSVIDCNSLPSTPTPTGSRVSIVDSPTLTFLTLSSHTTTLNAGQSTAADMLDSGDEFVVFKTGTVDATVNGVTARMQEGPMLYWCAQR